MAQNSPLMPEGDRKFEVASSHGPPWVIRCSVLCDSLLLGLSLTRVQTYIDVHLGCLGDGYVIKLSRD